MTKNEVKSRVETKGSEAQPSTHHHEHRSLPSVAPITSNNLINSLMGGIIKLTDVVN